jgi:hypothetical protein
MWRQYLITLEDLFNGVLDNLIKVHLAPTLKKFVVGSLIPNLTPSPSFAYNSCILGLNEQCKGTLGITLQGISNDILGVQFGVCLPFQLRLWIFKSPPQMQHIWVWNAFGSHWAQSLTLSPTCGSVFHFQTHFLGFMCPCLPHLINLMVGLQQKPCIFFRCNLIGNGFVRRGLIIANNECNFYKLSILIYWTRCHDFGTEIKIL